MRLRLAIVFAALGLLAAAPSAAQAQGCITKLPVSHSFKSVYAASYRAKTMTVKVTSQGSWIHHIKAELYTFGGELIGKSKLYRHGFNTTKALKLKLTYGAMQSGKYTLVVTGEPNNNRSCGPKRYTRVVEFQNCPKSLPIEFPNAPDGKAGDYGRWLSVNLRSTGGIMRNIVVELYDFDNNLFARGKLRALFGTAKVDLKLRHKLVNGGYTLLVDGDGGLPRACGHKQARKVLTFGTKKSGGTEQSGGDPGGSGDDMAEEPLDEEDYPPEDDFGYEEGGDGSEARR